MTKDELADVTRASHRALEAELAALSDEQMLTPGVIDDWTIKDALAHISAWERMFIGWIEAFERGTPPDRPKVVDQAWTDQLNARLYDENRGRPLADVRAESQASHEAILALIERVGEGLFDPDRFPWARGNAIASWLRSNADEHYDEHREQIAAWRAQQGAAS